MSKKFEYKEVVEKSNAELSTKININVRSYLNSDRNYKKIGYIKRLQYNCQKVKFY